MRKNLLVITSTFPRWANDVEPPFVFDLCRHLSSHFDIHVLAPHAPGAATEERLDGISVTRFRYFWPRWELLAYHGGILANLKQNPLRFGLIPLFLAGQLLALIKLLRKCRFDCIHAHWLVPQGAAAVLARRLARRMPPLLCTSHGGDLFALQGWGLNQLKYRVARRSEALTVVSQAMHEVLTEMGVDPKRIRVIPMGVDLNSRFVPPANRSGTGNLLFVGRLVEKKGLHYLIEALPEICEQHPHSVLRIVGDGPEQTRLAKRVAELGMTSAVNFLGALDNSELPFFYQQADVVIFPSVVAADGDQEGFGLVLVEALGCGCAVVATDLAAARDIVREGQTASIVRQRDTYHLAAKVIQLLDDADLRDRLGTEGRRHVFKQFDWTSIADRYKDFILAVIAEHRAY